MDVKRFFDLSVSFVLVLIISPVGLIIALFVWIIDGRPVFFIQKRVGLHGCLFDLYKFRSMRVLKGSEDGSFDAGCQLRITRIGRVLRQTKLDELPQLWNVIKGDMSLVGPRPEVSKWVAVYPHLWDKVLSVKPGITDNASILYRNEEHLLAMAIDPEDTYKNKILPEKLQLYLKYVNEQNMVGDLIILVKTVWRLV